MRFWLILACCLLASGVFGEEKTENADKRSRVEDIPELVAVASDDKEDDSNTDEEEPKRLVCYFNFETKPDSKIKKGTIRVIQDKSGYDNNGDFSVGGEILKYSDKDFTCNQAARLWESDILFKGDLFQAKPRRAITVAAWIKLEEKPGQHSIFDTIGVSHSQGQFHFEVNDGVLRWFHRNECKQTVFETMSHTVAKDKWTHVAGTYDSKTRQAKVFINGALRNMSIGEGELSRDWATRAGIGNHLKHRPLRGSIDEFRIYNYALKLDEIKALVGACRNTDGGEGRSELPEQSNEVKKGIFVDGLPVKEEPGSKRQCCLDSPEAPDPNDDDDEDEPKRLVVYYNFEKVARHGKISDKSGYENSGTMAVGGEILKFSDKEYTCNQGARLYDHDITLRGDTFQAKPKSAITIAAWVKLEEKQGQHSLFDTVGASHSQGQFHFEIDDGVVRWFHRNEKQQVVFETMAHTVKKGQWTHVAGTYDAKTKQAKIYINGEIRNQSIGEGMLSRDWGVRAGIGQHDKVKALRGSIDEFRIYNYALKNDEIKALVTACMAGGVEEGAKAAESATNPPAPEGAAITNQPQVDQTGSTRTLSSVSDKEKDEEKSSESSVDTKGACSSHSVLRPNIEKRRADDEPEESNEDEEDDDEPRRLVVYFDFETFKPDKRYIVGDKSGYSNTATMEEGGLYLKYNDPDYTCNQAARLWDQDILLKGALFQGKPVKGITIAAWIKLEQKIGSHSVFDTIGQSHLQGQYHFEVNAGVFRWFHRNEYRQTVFETMAHAVKKEKWTHIAGTYDSKTKHAKVYIDGQIRNQSLGEGLLSRDWGRHAGIGDWRKGRGLHGAVDEFRIYNYPLKPQEIKALYEACYSKNGESSGKNVPEALSPKPEKSGKDTARTSVPTIKVKELVINAGAALAKPRRKHGKHIKHKKLSNDETGSKREPPVLVTTATEDDKKEDDDDVDENKRLVVYLNFEKVEENKNKISDKSGFDNNGKMSHGVEILKYNDAGYTCNQAARIWDSDITFNGNTFQGKPSNAITVSSWVKLEESTGQHTVFATIGRYHEQGQYHFEVISGGVVRWFHRNEMQQRIFEVQSHNVTQGKWNHLAGTYDSKTGQAKIFINGELRNMSIGHGKLSKDWDVFTGLGNYLKQRPLRGSIDEFRMYNYALKPEEINALVLACKSDSSKKTADVKIIEQKTNPNEKDEGEASQEKRTQKSANLEKSVKVTKDNDDKK